jgi:hypothetical protein
VVKEAFPSFRAFWIYRAGENDGSEKTVRKELRANVLAKRFQWEDNYVALIFFRPFRYLNPRAITFLWPRREQENHYPTLRILRKVSVVNASSYPRGVTAQCTGCRKTWRFPKLEASDVVRELFGL